MGDDLLNGGALIRREMEMRAQKESEHKLQDRQEKLLAQSRVLRFLRRDDFVLSLRAEATRLRDNAVAKIIDPTKRGREETLETLAIEARCHQEYVDMFDSLESLGKKAAETLQNESEKKGE